LSSINESPEQLKRAESIFHEVLSAPEDQRATLMEAQCEGDAEMRDELQALIENSGRKELQSLLSSEAIHAQRRQMDPDLSGRWIGPYELDRLLGRGGMGAVYLAHRADGEFRQQVAIKLIDLPLAGSLFREQFRRERQILAGLVHPFIARLLDGGVSDEGEPYLVMEYVDGVSILNYCEEHSLKLRDRLILFRQVCEAVQFAHQNLVIHRDLKADNILVVADGTPRLLDFGTAKLLATEDAPASELTRQGVQSFTPQYASPEQVLGKSITTASDTYSLGVLLYRMIAGVRPYELKDFSTEELIRVICKEEPPKPSAIAISAEHPDGDLDAIAMKALRKAPEDRYGTVQQFAADIQLYLDGKPVTARRGTLRYRAGKFARRNKMGLAGAGLLFATMLAGVAGILWQSHAKDLERRRAEARSEDLRQLSNSLLSEIDEAVKELPGSTPVQQLLVKRVLEHLDHMATDAAGDPVTQLDLVDAYTRLGNLQGNPYEQNIGDSSGALVSLNKALTIAQTLQSVRPRDPAVLGALATVQKARSNVLFGISRTQESIVAMRAAIQAFEAEFANAPASPAQLAEEAGAYNGLGDQLGLPGVASLGDSAGALDAYSKALELSRRALSIDPKFTRSRRTVAIGYTKIGDIDVQTDPAKAAAEYYQSLAAWSAMFADGDSSATNQRGAARVYLRLGSALSAILDYKSSIAAFEKAAVTIRRDAAIDPRDTRAQSDLFALEDNEAKAYVEMLDPRLDPNPAGKTESAHHAMSLLRDSMGILEKLLQVDPGNKIWLSNLAYDKTILGTLEQSWHAPDDGSGSDTEKGAQLAASGVAELLKAASSENASMDVLDLSTTATLNVLPVHLRNIQEVTRNAERLASLSHRKNPGYLLTLAQAYRAGGQTAKAIAVAREGLALLPEHQSDPAGRPVTRTEKLLEIEAQP
jgi:serine/threonine protein kinase/tetratricopeptide (TPR) repeat protein